jgi:3D (Asp-Asp-Asp) domain-containing protein
VSYLLRRALPMLLAVFSFVLLYEATLADSRFAARTAELTAGTAMPTPGARLRFSATAYCKGSITASGVPPRTGIAAADADLLPVGSVIQVDTGEPRYSGVYTIMDTGPAVKGRAIDVYMWSCYEALDFGRRPVQILVLRLGWNPRASRPGVAESLFRQREQQQLDAAPLPSTPIPVVPLEPPQAPLP